MIEFTDECVGCPKEMGCLGNSCPHMSVPHYYCDYCGDELPDGYIEYDGGEYCESCFWEITGARKVER